MSSSYSSELQHSLLLVFASYAVRFLHIFSSLQHWDITWPNPDEIICFCSSAGRSTRALFSPLRWYSPGIYISLFSQQPTLLPISLHLCQWKSQTSRAIRAHLQQRQKTGHYSRNINSSSSHDIDFSTVKLNVGLPPFHPPVPPCSMRTFLALSQTPS